MASTPKLARLGGFSSCCIFNRDMGCPDEEASREELLAKVLYFFPHTTSSEAQLKHVGLCEGLIDFQLQFGVDHSAATINMERRRFVVRLVEPPAVWMVLVLVNPLFVVPGPMSPTTASSTTSAPSSTGGSGGKGAGAGAGVGAGSPTAESLGRPSCRDVPSEVLQCVVNNLIATFRLFFGSFRRVLCTPHAIAHDIKLRELRKRIRKAKLKAELDAFKAEVSGDAPAIGVGQDITPLVQELRQLEATSPVNAVRATLRDFMDFMLFYVDFSRVAVFNHLDGLHIFPVNRLLYRSVNSFVTNLRKATDKAITHVTFLADGHVVWGSRNPHVPDLYRFLRFFAYHHVSGSFTRPTSSAKGVSTHKFHAGGKPAPGTPPPLVSAAAATGTIKGVQPLPSTFHLFTRGPVDVQPPVAAGATPPTDAAPAAATTSPPPSSDASTPHDGSGSGDDSGGGGGAATPKAAGRRVASRWHPRVDGMFSPVLFFDPDSPSPSHRLLWYQYERLSLLLYVDLAAVNGSDLADGGGAAAAAAEKGKRTGPPPCGRVNLEAWTALCDTITRHVNNEEVGLRTLGQVLEQHGETLQRELQMSSTTVTQYILYNSEHDSVRLNGMGCSIGTPVYAKTTSMVTSAFLTTKAMMQELPWELIMAVGTARSRFATCENDRAEAIVVPAGRSGAIVARKRENRQVFVFFPSSTATADRLYERVVEAFAAALE